TPVTPPRQHHMYILSTITKALKVWSLAAKLEKNCWIKDENMTRETITIKHMDDPVAYLDPGLDAASFIMIEDEEIQALCTLSFANKF
ncbi:hypothetical protein EDD18DRAFT_1015178, partial [Armillaria luteobubalina]